MYGIIERGTEVRFFQQRAFKDSAQQIAIVKDRLMEIAFCKITFPQPAVCETCLACLDLKKRGMIQQALFKRKGKSEGIAGVPAESHKLAVFEAGIAQGCIVEPGQTHVAFMKQTICEYETGKVAQTEITMPKLTVFVFSRR